MIQARTMPRIAVARENLHEVRERKANDDAALKWTDIDRQLGVMVENDYAPKTKLGGNGYQF